MPPQRSHGNGGLSTPVRRARDMFGIPRVESPYAHNPEKRAKAKSDRDVSLLGPNNDQAYSSLLWAFVTSTALAPVTMCQHMMSVAKWALGFETALPALVPEVPDVSTNACPPDGAVSEPSVQPIEPAKPKRAHKPMPRTPQPMSMLDRTLIPHNPGLTPAPVRVDRNERERERGELADFVRASMAASQESTQDLLSLPAFFKKEIKPEQRTALLNTFHDKVWEASKLRVLKVYKAQPEVNIYISNSDDDSEPTSSPLSSTAHPPTQKAFSFQQYSSTLQSRPAPPQTKAPLGDRNANAVVATRDPLFLQPSLPKAVSKRPAPLTADAPTTPSKRIKVTNATKRAYGTPSRLPQEGAKLGPMDEFHVNMSKTQDRKYGSLMLQFNLDIGDLKRSLSSGRLPPIPIDIRMKRADILAWAKVLSDSSFLKRAAIEVKIPFEPIFNDKTIAKRGEEMINVYVTEANFREPAPRPLASIMKQFNVEEKDVMRRKCNYLPLRNEWKKTRCYDWVFADPLGEDLHEHKEIPIEMSCGFEISNQDPRMWHCPFLTGSDSLGKLKARYDLKAKLSKTDLLWAKLIQEISYHNADLAKRYRQMDLIRKRREVLFNEYEKVQLVLVKELPKRRVTFAEGTKRHTVTTPSPAPSPYMVTAKKMKSNDGLTVATASVNLRDDPISAAAMLAIADFSANVRANAEAADEVFEFQAPAQAPSAFDLARSKKQHKGYQLSLGEVPKEFRGNHPGTFSAWVEDNVHNAFLEEDLVDGKLPKSKGIYNWQREFRESGPGKIARITEVSGKTTEYQIATADGDLKPLNFKPVTVEEVPDESEATKTVEAQTVKAVEPVENPTPPTAEKPTPLAAEKQILPAPSGLGGLFGRVKNADSSDVLPRFVAPAPVPTFNFGAAPSAETSDAQQFKFGDKQVTAAPASKPVGTTSGIFGPSNEFNFAKPPVPNPSLFAASVPVAPASSNSLFDRIKTVDSVAQAQSAKPVETVIKPVDATPVSLFGTVKPAAVNPVEVAPANPVAAAPVSLFGPVKDANGTGVSAPASTSMAPPPLLFGASKTATTTSGFNFAGDDSNPFSLNSIKTSTSVGKTQVTKPDTPKATSIFGAAPDGTASAEKFNQLFQPLPSAVPPTAIQGFNFGSNTGNSNFTFGAGANTTQGSLFGNNTTSTFGNGSSNPSSGSVSIFSSFDSSNTSATNSDAEVGNILQPSNGAANRTAAGQTVKGGLAPAFNFSASGISAAPVAAVTNAELGMFGAPKQTPSTQGMFGTPKQPSAPSLFGTPKQPSVQFGAPTSHPGLATPKGNTSLTQASPMEPSPGAMDITPKQPFSPKRKNEEPDHFNKASKTGLTSTPGLFGQSFGSNFSTNFGGPLSNAPLQLNAATPPSFNFGASTTSFGENAPPAIQFGAAPMPSFPKQPQSNLFNTSTAVASPPVSSTTLFNGSFSPAPPAASSFTFGATPQGTPAMNSGGSFGASFGAPVQAPSFGSPAPDDNLFAFQPPSAAEAGGTLGRNIKKASSRLVKKGGSLRK